MENDNYSRRRFLKTLGLGAAALSLPSFKLFGNHVSDSYEANIGLQLYSIRRQIEKDLEGSIANVAKTGIMGIESYPLPKNLELNFAAKVFRNNGIKIFSMHNDLPIGAEKDNILRQADAYHCDRAVFAGFPENEKYKDLDTIKKTAETYNESYAFLKSRNIKFGLHNHWWEFEKHHDYYPAYYLLEHLDKGIFFEIDTYWVKTSGQNPAKVVADFGSRAPLLHIKDGPAIKGEKSYEQVPVGQGIMDVPAIVKAGGKNIKWMIIEFDEYAGNIFEAIQSSYSYLTKNKLGKGNV
jgi:sugar phosphate isomerase/epimerase